MSFYILQCIICIYVFSILLYFSFHLYLFIFIIPYIYFTFMLNTFIILFNSQCPCILTCKVHSKMKESPLIDYDFEILLTWSSFEKWIWQTQSAFKGPEAFRGGWIKTATSMFLSTKLLLLRWGYWDNEKILNLKSIPECATLKINLIHPLSPLSLFFFLEISEKLST